MNQFTMPERLVKQNAFQANMSYLETINKEKEEELSLDLENLEIELKMLESYIRPRDKEAQRTYRNLMNSLHKHFEKIDDELVKADYVDPLSAHRTLGDIEEMLIALQTKIRVFSTFLCRRQTSA